MGDILTIQPFGGGGAVDVTFVGYVIDDGDFYPVFEVADFGGQGRAQFIGTSEPDGTDHYAAAANDIIAATLRLGVESTFSNYGFRQEADLDGDFTLQGDGPNDGLNVPNDVYEAGDTLMIQPFGGEAAGPAVEVTFKGFVIDDGNRYPVFDAADFDSDGDGIGNEPARFIGTDETGTGSYTPGDIDTDEPYEQGFSRFLNVAWRSGEGSGVNQIPFTFTDDGPIDIENREWRMGDPLGRTFTLSGFDFKPTFSGYEAGTFYPIFTAQPEGFPGGEQGDFAFILIDEERNPDFFGIYGRAQEYPPPPDRPGVDPRNNFSNPVVQVVRGETYTPCFAPGTLIATPDGERAVETLKPGDVVLTAHDGVATVKWVGVQKIPTMFGARELTHPVRIMAGALDDNVPHTDLVVTKDHGMIVDGVICQAGALINGTSIVEVSPGELNAGPPGSVYGVATYYHVETENHVLLLANGAAAESFIDNVDRSVFGNHSEFVALYGERLPPMTEMTLPRAMSARQLPKRISSRLATRASIILRSVVKGPVARSG